MYRLGTSLVLLVTSAATLGCSSSGSGSASGDTAGQAGGGSSGTGATAGSGGTAGAGGSGGAGAAAGSGGGAGTSPGTATLEFQVPTSKSYCYESQCGGSQGVISILDTAGKLLVLSPGDCYTECGSCEMLPCPGAACMPQGYAVTGGQLVWDGHYYSSGMCGSNTQCYGKTFAEPGTYTAKMCATPGTLAPDNDGIEHCTVTGAAECVEVSFSLPSATPVVGKLPE